LASSESLLREVLTEVLRERVFIINKASANEVGILVAFRDELVLAIGGANDAAGFWTSTDGETWKQKFALNPSYWWSYQLFNGKLYLGGGDGSTKAFIYCYDGTTFTKVFEQTDGGGGAGQGLVEALGVYNNYIYAGRKNQIWRSADGTSWTQVHTFATNKGIYQFSPEGANFMAYEGEPVSAPSKIYHTVDGTTWTDWATVNDVTWFRSHSPSDRILLGSNFQFIAHGGGYVIIRAADIWNQQFLFIPDPSNGGYAAMKCKRIENYMGICSGEASNLPAQGRFYVWDGNCLKLIAKLPFGVYDFEMFKGNIYLACSTITKAYETDYAANQIVVIRLPENTLNNGKSEPMTIPLFEGKSIDTGGYAAGFIPILGYDDVTVFIDSTQAGNLVLQKLDVPSFTWKDVETVAISANTPTTKVVSWRTKFLRLKFTPSATATVTLSASLS